MTAVTKIKTWKVAAQNGMSWVGHGKADKPERIRAKFVAGPDINKQLTVNTSDHKEAAQKLMDSLGVKGKLLHHATNDYGETWRVEDYLPHGATKSELVDEIRTARSGLVMTGGATVPPSKDYATGWAAGADAMAAEISSRVSGRQ